MEFVDRKHELFRLKKVTDYHTSTLTIISENITTILHRRHFQTASDHLLILLSIDFQP